MKPTFLITILLAGCADNSLTVFSPVPDAAIVEPAPTVEVDAAAPSPDAEELFDPGPPLTYPDDARIPGNNDLGGGSAVYQLHPDAERRTNITKDTNCAANDMWWFPEQNSSTYCGRLTDGCLLVCGVLNGCTAEFLPGGVNVQIARCPK